MCCICLCTFKSNCDISCITGASIPLKLLQGEQLSVLPRVELPDASTMQHCDVPRPAAVTLLGMAYAPVYLRSGDATTVEHPSRSKVSPMLGASDTTLNTYLQVSIHMGPSLVFSGGTWPSLYCSRKSMAARTIDAARCKGVCGRCFGCSLNPSVLGKVSSSDSSAQCIASTYSSMRH